ncbi:serine hydrolase [Streptomyces erythrochromogenes]|uniref:serine hydrolase n=1 Tax=Streptomyces erythrochromogenes TaxID=285574 RepID=UPI00382FA9F0
MTKVGAPGARTVFCAVVDGGHGPYGYRGAAAPGPDTGPVHDTTAVFASGRTLSLLTYERPTGGSAPGDQYICGADHAICFPALDAYVGRPGAQRAVSGLSVRPGIVLLTKRATAGRNVMSSRSDQISQAAPAEFVRATAADPVPVDRNTLFQLGSVTKTYMVTALMRLVAEKARVVGSG